MKAIFLVSTTFENKEDAEQITDLLLKQNLIACAQITGPITSIYRWEGKTEKSTEFKLSLKTTVQLSEKVEELLEKEHPYDVPEIIGQIVDFTNNEYLEWVYSEVQQ